VHPPSKHPKRPRRILPVTFAEIRLNAETRLRHGLKLDFEQIMGDIAAVQAHAEKTTKKSVN